MTFRFARIAVSLLTAGSITAVACIDMSAPKGAASISLLQAPTPVVVLGDTMRDTTGAVAPLNVVAYDVNGNPVSGLTPQFFITDSSHTARLVLDNRVLVGDKIGIVHIVGQIGAIQTPAATIQVSYAPATIKKLGSDTALVAPIGPDSASSVGRVTLPIALRSAQDSASQGFLVTYTLLYAPATLASRKSPAVFLADDQGAISKVDTSDASGASRHLVVISRFLADDDLRAGKKTDSAIVEVSVKYKGAPVSGGPIRFTIPITAAFPTK